MRTLLPLTVLFALTGALGQGVLESAPEPDPSSCRQYLAGGEARQCPEQLLFDSVSLTCLPADQAACAQASSVDTEPAAPLLRKCCPEQQQFDLTNGACVDRQGPWTLPVYKSDPLQPTAPELLPGAANYTIWAQALTDCQGLLLNQGKDFPDAIFPLDNGFLYAQGYRTIYKPTAYCLETLIPDNEAPRLGALVCTDAAEQDIIPVSDDRVSVSRCCARNVKLSDDGCMFDELHQHQDELPPPLADEELWTAITAENIDAYLKFSVGLPQCNQSSMGVMVSMDDSPFAIGPDGSLRLLHSNITVAPEDFCYNERSADFIDDDGEATTALAIVCADEPTQAALTEPSPSPSCEDGSDECVRKCCAPGYEVLLTETAGGSLAMSCVFTRRQLEVSALPSVAAELHGARPVSHQPPCENGLFQVEEGNFTVLANGAFRLVQYDEYACNYHTAFDAKPSEYCLDTVRGSTKPGHAFYCYPTTDKDDGNATYIFFPILMGITDFFLLVTFIVYLTVPDPTQTGLNKQRKLSQSVLGMILLAYISSLFFGYLVLMIVQTATAALTVYRTACKVLAVILYFFLLSAFFWLSVICFEIYLTTRADSRSSGRKRFRLYVLYAWGCPVLMASLALIMDFAPGIDNCTFIKPAFGRYRCLFQNRSAFVAYFYIPIGVLLGICVLLYILTVRNLSVPSKMPGKGDSETMSKQSAKQQAKRRRLCAKLFLIMGITWIAELLSYFIGDSPVWYFFDVINILQGFFIFVAFILRPKVLQYIKKTALQSLSRSFGHDSQNDAAGGGPGGHHPHPAGAAHMSPAHRVMGQQPSSPITMSTRVTGGTSGTGCPQTAAL